MIPDQKTKERSTDRILVLRPIEGKTAMSSTGLFDNRLFTGDNNLHAIMDLQTRLWYLKYDSGGLTTPMQQKFTTFDNLYAFVRKYFLSRNIQIVEVRD